MKLSKSVRSISYLKSHTAEILKELSAVQEPLIVTQNGEAKAVVQDIASYERTQESLAMLKMLALSTRNIAEGKSKSINRAFGDIRKKIADSD